MGCFRFTLAAMVFSSRHIGFVSLLILGGVAIGPSPDLYGTDLAKETSISLAPQDADFYSSSLRLREQWEKLLQSKVANEIQKIEFVQKVIQKVRMEWESGNEQVDQAKAVLRTPLAQDVIQLVGEMLEQETFVMGDKNFSELLLEFTAWQAEIASVNANEGPEGMLEWIKSLTKDDFDEIPVPTSVLGFKIKDKDRALNLLDQIQALVALGKGAIPQLSDARDLLERVEDKRGTRLVLTLSTDMIPWDAIPQNTPDQEEILETLEEALEDRQICLTIGLLDSYFLLGISEEPEEISELGKVPSLLDHPHLAPLKSNASKDITSISYLSDAFTQAQFQSQLKGYFSKLYPQFKPLLELAFSGELPEFLEPVESDLEWLDDEMDRIVPTPRGNLAFTYMTDRGTDGVVYQRTKTVLLDGQDQLEILKHVGTDPLAMVAVRHQYHPEWFALSRKVVQKVRRYLDGILESDLLSDEDQSEMEVVVQRGWPLMKRFADTWEKKILPSTRNGQHAWVLSTGNLSSTQWAKDMPPSDQPLPLPEIATVSGISDKPLFLEGCIELYSEMDDLVDILRELGPGSIPEGYTIPRPEKRNEGGLEVYLYPIPDDCPVPKDMAPQVAVDDRWAISSYSNAQSKMLRKESRLQLGWDGFDPNARLAAVFHMNLGGLVKAFQPWLRYGLLQDKGDLNAPLAPDNDQVPPITGSDVIAIWKALGHLGQVTASTTIDQEGGSVTRWSYRD